MKYSVCQMEKKKRNDFVYNLKPPKSMQKRRTNKNTEEKKHSQPLKHISYLKRFRSNQFSQEM